MDQNIRSGRGGLLLEKSFGPVAKGAGRRYRVVVYLGIQTIQHLLTFDIILMAW